MRRTPKLATIVCGCLALCLTTSLMARSRTAAGRVPHRYQPSSQDQQLVQVKNPVDGRTWAAWAYRSGAQYDLALTVAGEDGVWSEPIFIGRNDDRDQIDPVLAIHDSGVMFVAFAEPERGRILISVSPPGSFSWSRPVPVAEKADARSPSILILFDHLVLAYRSGDRVEVIDVPLLESSPSGGTRGFSDGPDTTGSGVEDEDNPGDDEEEDGGASKTGMVRAGGGAP